MGMAKFAIIMPSDSNWETTSPCKDEVDEIIQKGLKIFNIRIDDTCHTCISFSDRLWSRLRPQASSRPS